MTCTRHHGLYTLIYPHTGSPHAIRFILRDASSTSKTRFSFFCRGQTAHNRKTNSPYQDNVSATSLDSCTCGCSWIGSVKGVPAMAHAPRRWDSRFVGRHMGFVAKEKRVGSPDSRILLGSWAMTLNYAQNRAFVAKETDSDSSRIMQIQRERTAHQLPKARRLVSSFSQ